MNTLYRFIEGENETPPYNEDIFAELEAIEIEPESSESFTVSREINIFDELESIENETEEATVIDRIKDTGIDIAKGAVDLGESFVGLTKMVAPVTRLGFDAIGYDAEQTGKFLSDLYSDERKEEEAEVEDATGVVDTIKALIKNPAATAGQAVQMAPGMLGIMGAARVMLARSSAAAIKAAGIKGITDPKTLANIGRKAGEKAAAITAAAAEGIQQTGSSFNRLIDNAESVGKAYTSAILSGVGTAGFAFLGGKLGRKLGLGDVEAGIPGKGGTVRKVAGGAIQEGILEETPQSMQETAWNNYATGRPLLEGVPKAGTTGLVLGSIMGGGMAGATTLATKTEKETKEKVFDDLEMIEGDKEPESTEKIFEKAKKDYLAGKLKDEDIEGLKGKLPDTPVGKEYIKRFDAILAEGKKQRETATFEAEEARKESPEYKEAIAALESVGTRVFGDKFETGKIKVAPETKETESLRKVASSLNLGNINFYDARGTQLDGVNGFYDVATKQIYLNTNAERPLLVVMGHESLHKIKKDKPDLYKSLKPILTGKALGFDKYVENLNSAREEAGLKPVDTAKASEEFIADFVGTRLTKASFWKKLHEQDPTLTRNLADVLTELIKKIRKALTGRDAKNYFKDLDAIETEIAKIYAQYAKPEAKKETAVPELKTTGEAKDYGKKATPEQVEALRVKHKEVISKANALIEQYKEALEAGNNEKATKLLGEAGYMTQKDAAFLLEAIQAAEGRDFEKKQREEAEKKKIEQPAKAEEAKKPSEPEKTKEPWEMTLSEYESIHGKPRKGATSYTENTFHKNAVHTAINQGKPVPEEVLKDYPDLQKPLSPKKKKKERIPGTNVRTMRGYIKFLGGINFLNYKGEAKDMSLDVKYLQNKKTGIPIDSLVEQLIDDNWLDKGTSVADFLEALRTDSKTLLSRDRLTVEPTEKKEYQKSEREKKFEKELAHEPETPPKGEYIQMKAEDLPIGKELTILEGKSATGWDVYEVTAKTKTAVKLMDGTEVELEPGAKVEVLRKDLSEKEAAKEKKDEVPFSVKDYKGVHTAPEKDGYAAPGHNLTDMYPDDIYSSKGAQYYGDRSPFDQESISIIRMMKGKPNKRISVYRAVPKVLTTSERMAEIEKHKAYILKTGKLPKGITNYPNSSEYYDDISEELDDLKTKDITQEQKTVINPGDWVTINRRYAVGHGESQLDGKYKILKKTVTAKEIFTDANSIHEWGYNPDVDGEPMFSVKEQMDLFEQKPTQKDIFGETKQKTKEKKTEPKAVFGQKMAEKGKKKKEVPTSVQLDLFEKNKKQMQTTMFDVKDVQPVWYSQMEKVLSQKLPGKGTPESMLQSINSFAKKGEFKSEELEWSGVNEWLDEQGSGSKAKIAEHEKNIRNQRQIIKNAEKEENAERFIRNAEEIIKDDQAEIERLKSNKVTKQQVLDYLKENNVRVQEVVRSENKIFREAEEASERMREIRNELRGSSVPYVSGRPLRWMIKNANEEPVDVPVKYHKELDTLQDSIAVAGSYEEGAPAGLSPKFSQYTEPGGENYKEVLLTLPTREESRYNLIEHKTGKAIKSFKNYDAAFEYINSKEFNDFAIKGKTNYGIAPAKKTADYTGSHWEEPNVLAHLRLNERTDSEGNKILFTEEVQSDWASDIRKKGVDKSDRKKIEKARKEMDAFASTMKEKYNDPRPYHVMAADEQSKLKELQKIYDRALGETGSVPDMPFKKTYYLLAMKRMVRLAAEGGFDAVAWGKGAVHFARWGSERIMWKKHKNSWLVDVKEQIGGNVEHEGQRIDIEAMAEAKGMNTQSNTLVTTRDGLRDMIDSIAQRERGNYTPAIYEKMVDARTDKTWKRMQDEDFGVSLPRKEGFENIYDEMIPNEVNKFFNKKKWGNAKVGVEKITMPDELKAHKDVRIVRKDGIYLIEVQDEAGKWHAASTKNTIEEAKLVAKNLQQAGKPQEKEIWILPITPSMKQKALREGMPLFMVKAYHGSPHTFDKFTAEKIGTGEGAQAFGWGLYFTDEEGIARDYARQVKTDAQITGVTGTVKSWVRDAYWGSDTKDGAIKWLQGSLKNWEQAKKTVERSKNLKGTVDYASGIETIKEAINKIKSGEAKINRNLYKVTLHKGKKPGEYEWLEWEQTLSADTLSKIKTQLNKEKNVSPKAIAYIKTQLGEKISLKEYASIYGAEENPEQYRGEWEAYNSGRKDWVASSEGMEFYQTLSGQLGSDKEASLFLLRAGIDGIKYPTGTLSGVKDSDKFNYVVFDENAVEIEKHEQFSVKKKK